MASTQVLHPSYSTKNDSVPAAGDGQQIQNVQETNHAATKKKMIVAYLLWFPFGILGAHRFYLGQWFMGIVYIFTGGYCGIGWLADAFVLPRLVQNHNLQAKHDAAHPRELKKCPESCCRELYYCSLIDAYILTLPPFGILGIQHQYIHRPWHRLAYTVSGGLFGVGWVGLSDFFRMPSLVKKANEDTWKLRNGMSLSAVSKESDCDVLQAYLLAIPGFFGFHHFYLGRWKIGLTYLFTLGLCGIGWLADLTRMPYLVERSNRERKADQLNTKHVDDAYLFAFPLGLLGFHHFYL